MRDFKNDSAGFSYSRYAATDSAEMASHATRQNPQLDSLSDASTRVNT